MLQQAYKPLTSGHGSFDFATYFEGATSAKGFVENRFGRRKRSFDADFHGEWCNDIFLLHESFVFCDSKTEQRIWRVHFGGTDSFTTTCIAAVGHGTGHHTETGCQHHFVYRLPIGKRTVNVRVQECYYAFPPDQLLYRARIKKWGVLAGTIFMAFTKV